MSSQSRKNCQRVNLNHTDAKVIGSSLIDIGPKLAQDIVRLRDCISTEQGHYLEVADLTLITEKHIPQDTWKQNFACLFICFNDNLVPPPYAEIQSAFPNMYTQDKLVEYDEEVLHHVLQIKVIMNEDVHRLQGLIDVQDQELSSIKVEVDDQVHKLKAPFNDMLKNTLDEHAKKINEQVQGQLVDTKSTLDNKIALKVMS